MGIIQQVGAGNTTATNPTISVGSTVAGNFLYVVIWNNASTTVNSVTDNQGQTWTQAFSPAHVYFTAFYKANTAAGVTTVTINLAATSETGIIFMERDDAPTTSPVDTTTADNDQSAITAVTSTTSATTGQATTFGIGAHGTGDSGGITVTAGSLWTAASGTGLSGGRVSVPGGAVLYLQTQDFTTTQAVTSTCTASVASGWTSNVIIIKRNVVAAATLMGAACL